MICNRSILSSVSLTLFSAHAFGGNPDQVTIWGQSAGSMSVSMHQMSPLSKGLYKRTLLESGSCFITTYNHTWMQYKMKDTIDAMAKEAKCPTKDDAEQLSCLQNADPETLLMSSAIAMTGALLVPIVDGNYMLESPVDILNSDKVYNPDVDILFSASTHEGDMFLLLPMNNDVLNKDFGEAGLKSKIPVIANSLNANKGELLTHVLEYAYLPDEGSPTSDYQEAYIDLGSHFMTMPILVEAQHYAKYSTKSKVYLFNFDYRPSWSENLAFVKAGHLDQPTLLLYNEAGGFKFTSQDMTMKDYLIEAYTNFVKTGTPSDEWKAATADTLTYNKMDTSGTVTTGNMATYMGKKLQLWRDVIFKIRDRKPYCPDRDKEDSCAANPDKCG